MAPLTGPALVLLGCAALLGACGSTEETQSTPPPPPPPHAEAPPRPRNDFETKTDTVRASGQTMRPGTDAKLRQPAIRFTVQIGAFKDPHHASRVQEVARERYHIPVVNDYHTVLGLYQIRIGFFETRGAAHEFRRRMLAEFGSDYKDSWVVQMKR